MHKLVEPLTRFIDDGRIELDNNTVERSIRVARGFGRRRRTLGHRRLADRTTSIRSGI
jgi:hypothetical protein